MIHNHEVRSSILRPATRKQHHRILCDVFLYARTQVRQGRSQYTMRAGSQWDTDEDGMPAGIGIQKTSANSPPAFLGNRHHSPPAFLGNRHLRSKHGFIRRCEASTGASCDPLQESNITEFSVMFFRMPGRQPVKSGVSIP